MLRLCTYSSDAQIQVLPRPVNFDALMRQHHRAQGRSFHKPAARSGLVDGGENIQPD